jgi:hypothetical protein
MWLERGLKVRMTGWKLIALSAVAVLFCQSTCICAETDAGASNLHNMQDELADWSFFSGSDKQNGYKISVDRDTVFRGKPALFIQSGKPDQSSQDFYAAPYQEFKATDYRGKRIEFAAYVRTRDVKGTAGLWFKANHNDDVVAFDDMDERALVGSNDWKKYAVVVNVPQNADAITIGVYLTGGGTVWFSGLSVLPVGDDVPLTAKVWDSHKHWRFEHGLRKEPIDLDLSQAAKHTESDQLLNWACHTSKSPGNAGMDRKVAFNGKPSLFIEQQANDPTDYVSSWQDISAAHYAGKRLCLEGYLKTSGVTDWTALWMRVDGGNKVLAFDNMEDRPIKGDTDWTKHKIVLDVPANATRIRLGFMQAGSGKSWLNSCTLIPVDNSIGTTAKSTTETPVPSDINAISPDLELKSK